MEQHIVLVVSENVDLSDIQDLTQLLGDVSEVGANEISKNVNKFESADLNLNNEITVTDSSVTSEKCMSTAVQEVENMTLRSGKMPARKNNKQLKHQENSVPHVKNVNDEDFVPEKGRPRNTRRIASKSQSKNSTADKPQFFNCEVCLRKFRQKGNLKAHLRVHTDEKPFICPNCEKGFKSREALLRHQYSHTGEKPYSCEICNKGFSSALALKEHQARHNNQVLYECQICNRGFRHVSALKRHSTTHSDATPFSCDICGRKFAQKSYLRSHHRSHTGERPFPCDKCGKSFAHPSDLSRHKIIHTGKKPFACKLCDARFSDPSSHRRHERDHTSTKNITCSNCNQSFKRPAQLKRHAEKCQKNNTTDEALIDVLETAQDESALILIQETSINSNNFNNDDGIMETTVVVETENNNERVSELAKLISDCDFVINPDFDSQDYYDWLSNFTSLVKLLTIPIENKLFTQISHVHKTLADVLAKPSGVLNKKENFQIMMDISHNLHNVITAHLCYVLNSLDEKE